jgi:hypothetical protein
MWRTADEADQQFAWSVYTRERKVRLVDTVGQLLFRLAVAWKLDYIETKMKR